MVEERAKIGEEVDYKALKYMIGDIGYVGKLADDIDRIKMNLLINEFINSNIFNKNKELETKSIKSIDFSLLENTNTEQILDSIQEDDATIFGLHEDVRPVEEHQTRVIGRLSLAYHQKH